MEVSGSILVVLGVCGGDARVERRGGGLLVPSTPQDNAAELTREGADESGSGALGRGVPRTTVAD